MLLAIGEHEPEAFRSQALAFHAECDTGVCVRVCARVCVCVCACRLRSIFTWKAGAWAAAELVDMPGHDHFTAVEQLSDPESVLTHHLLRLCSP